MFINDNGLIDLDLMGSKFTWSNRRVGMDNIQVILDRALVTISWFVEFSCSLSSIMIYVV